MTGPSLRFRQVHLDFHTHESLLSVGGEWDPRAFADTLEGACVDSINLFARCHHGWLYYDSARFADRRHPHLVTNLLKEQIDACHERDILTPAYVSVGWDALTAQRCPQWLVRNPDGSHQGPGMFDPGFYTWLCLNSPYADFLKDLVTDIAALLPVDGFWFDIVHARICCCSFCRNGMMEQGMDPSDDGERRLYGRQVAQRFKRDMTEHVRRVAPDRLVFYNAGHIGPSVRASDDDYTHYELESLPYGWGYHHFPATARYARTLGKEFLGMTGKFHTTWGDFHSFKNEAALAFECYLMLALAGKCCVGDQLPPHGRLCRTTYELIGSVYREVARREPWCERAVPVADIAVISPEALASDDGHRAIPEPVIGAMQMLQEAHGQFNIIDPDAALDPYRLLILPDDLPVDGRLAARITAFMDSGGRVIASWRAGLDPEGRDFNLPLGVRYGGEAAYEPTFVRPAQTFRTGLPAPEYVMYQRAAAVEALPQAVVLADSMEPYFNRTWRHYCSHRHAPSSGQVHGPAVVQSAGSIYFAHPIFGQYRDNAPLWCRQMLVNAVNALLPDPVLAVDGPPGLLVALNRQPDRNRYLVHLLHYIHTRNNRTCDIIEYAPPLYGIPISLRAGGTVQAVECVPEGAELDFQEKDGRVEFTVPEVNGYQIVSVRTGADAAP